MKRIITMVAALATLVVPMATAQKISDALRAVADPHERRELMDEYIGSTINDDLMSVTGDGYYFTRGEMEEVYASEY